MNFAKFLRKPFLQKTSARRLPNQPTERSAVDKHIELFLNEILSLTKYTNDQINNSLKGIGLLQKLAYYPEIVCKTTWTMERLSRIITS